MNNTKIFFVTLFLFLFLFAVHALKVDRKQSSHVKKDQDQNPVTKVENSTDSASCSKDFCMSKYGLMPDPFNPACEQNATCWRLWYGLPNCADDNLNCWKLAVGYPKDCKDDDYDCWMKAFGYAQCTDAQCLKKHLNYSCKYDDLQCWRTKTWLPTCRWNDWDCWVDSSFMGFLCGDRKGYGCVTYYYSDPCKKDDEKCWRKTLNLPDSECEKDEECFKKFYFLPDCKDDDFKCWKKLYWGPDCKQGDMACLKQYLYIPDCSKQDDQLHCYKKWLGYPDCKLDDGKCWKEFDKTKKDQSQLLWLSITTLDVRKAGQEHMSFGKIMEHKRKSMADGHKLTRQFHMKKAGLFNHLKGHNLAKVQSVQNGQ